MFLPDEEMADMLGHEVLDALGLEVLADIPVVLEVHVVVGVLLGHLAQVGADRVVPRLGDVLGRALVPLLLCPTVYRGTDDVPATIHICQESLDDKIKEHQNQIK